MNSKEWGVDIKKGANVTSEGRHGTGQPVVSGVVMRVEHGVAIVRSPDDMVRRRSVANLRRVD